MAYLRGTSKCAEAEKIEKTRNADLHAENQNTGNSAGQPEPIRIDGSYSWVMAETRAAAYMALGREYRDMWYLRGGTVFAIFMLCYVSVTLVQTLLWYGCSI